MMLRRKRGPERCCDVSKVTLLDTGRAGFTSKTPEALGRWEEEILLPLPYRDHLKIKGALKTGVQRNRKSWYDCRCQALGTQGDAETIASSKVLTSGLLSSLPPSVFFPSALPVSSMDVDGLTLLLLLFPWLSPRKGAHNRRGVGEGRRQPRRGGGEGAWKEEEAEKEKEG